MGSLAFFLVNKSNSSFLLFFPSFFCVLFVYNIISFTSPFLETLGLSALSSILRISSSAPAPLWLLLFYCLYQGQCVWLCLFLYVFVSICVAVSFLVCVCVYVCVCVRDDLPSDRKTKFVSVCVCVCV